MINIAIVDDHTIFLQGLAALLSNNHEFNIVLTDNDPISFLNKLSKVKADVVITDFSMPQMDGTQLAKEIKIKFPTTPILGLTMHQDIKIISKMMQAGISGYLLKNTNQEELYNAIKTVYAGNLYYSEEVKNEVLKSLTSQKNTYDRPQISQRELEILQLIAQEYTQQEIADKLFISSHTVVFHRRNLFLKFDVKNTAGLIKKATEMNFLS